MSEDKTLLFIKKANTIHNSFYLYTKTVYTTADQKVIITCPIHGDFQQTPHIHLSKHGCPQCGHNKNIEGIKLTTSEFIERANKVYNNKYDYSKIKYVDNSTHVEIICKEHGSFFQTPNAHLSGHGCKKCFYDSRKLTTESFIEKAKQVHNNRYDYSKSNYISTRRPIEIICKEHGSFFQKARCHLAGGNCPQCRKKTTENFIKDAIKKHGNHYDYKNVVYTGCFNKVEIICKKHGPFFQTPTTHLNGSGCPICKASHGELEVSRYLEQKRIMFERQKTFDDLFDKNKLLYDFYIPSMRLLIEYNGIQHYTPSKIFGGKEQFLIQQKHDKMKQEYAINNKYKLIIIKYTENVIDVLDNFFANAIKQGFYDENVMEMKCK